LSQEGNLPVSIFRRYPTFHVFVFFFALAAWTVALLAPVPHDSARQVLGSDLGVWLFAKTLHVTAYAILTIVGATAAAFGRKWLWVLPGLVVHGGLTEFFQQFVGRGARVEDVGLDSIGVAVGGLVAWGLRSLSPIVPEAEPSIPE
jgi:VanZ family protein